jgi:hypothetical protein
MADFITYKFPDHKSGDTFQGVAFTISVNGTPPSLVGATINMKVGDKTYSNTGRGEIEVTDALNCKFQLKEQRIILPPKTYDVAITILFADGKVKTYIRGTWRIL